MTVADAAELDELIRLLKAKANVVETDTRLVMRTVVRRTTVAWPSGPPWKCVQPSRMGSLATWLSTS